MIREATVSDIPQLVELIRLFHSKSFWSATEFEPDAVERLCRSAIENDDALLAVNDGVTGFAMFWAAPLPFSDKIQVAYEVGFYGGGAAIGLLRRVEEWAKGMGLYMIKTDEHLGMKSPARLYERFGYEPFEIIYKKVL